MNSRDSGFFQLSLYEQIEVWRIDTDHHIRLPGF